MVFNKLDLAQHIRYPSMAVCTTTTLRMHGQG
jgi:hypothetical protein